MTLKYTTLALISFTFIAQATVTISNFGAGTEPAIIDDGAILGDGLGVIAIGFFDELPDFSTIPDITGLTSTFNQLGSEFAFNGAAFNLDNSFFFHPQQDIDITTAVNEDAFLIIGNGSTLDNSTDFIVYDSGISFIDPSVADTTIVVNNVDNVVIGDIVDVPNAFSSATQSIQFAALVPEPTSGMLLGLAGLALVARRKR